MKILHGLIPGSDEWRAVRLRYPCASEAPAMMGASKHLTRGELLRMKATGNERVFSDYVQQRILNKGHASEARARVITEEDTGEELYAVAALSDDGSWLSTFDGLPMSEDWLLEHKDWNEELAAQVRAGKLEPHYYWQLEHQLLTCASAEHVLFVCSDGTRERRVEMRYTRQPGRAQQLIAGWQQFAADLAAYDHSAQPAPVKPAPQEVEALPAVSVRMDGQIAVIDNLDKFGAALRAYVAQLPKKPSTDQEFADCEDAVKRLDRAEKALATAEANALASIEQVEQMRRKVATFHKLSADTRLALGKLVTSRKAEIRADQVARGRQLLQVHLQRLDQRLGGQYMPAPTTDFAGVIRNLKKWDSLREAIDTALALAKVDANRLADETIQPNLDTLRELVPEALLPVLFRDKAELVLKPPADMRAIVAQRLADHQRAVAATPPPPAAPRYEGGAYYATPAAQAPAGATNASNVLPMHQPQPRGPLTADTAMNLGDIKAAIAPLTLDADGLALLGFPFVRIEKGSKLYHRADLPLICAALILHLERVRDKLQEAA